MKLQKKYRVRHRGVSVMFVDDTVFKGENLEEVNNK